MPSSRKKKFNSISASTALQADVAEVGDQIQAQLKAKAAYRIGIMITIITTGLGVLLAKAVA